MSIYAKINTILKDRYGVEVDFSNSADDLHDIMEHYCDKRETVVALYGNDAALNHPDYAKSHLISEAVRMYLREIAPKRLNKIKRKKS